MPASSPPAGVGGDQPVDFSRMGNFTGPSNSSRVSPSLQVTGSVYFSVCTSTPAARNAPTPHSTALAISGEPVTRPPEMAKAVEWGVGAFRAAGVDVHTEKYTLPVTWSEGDTRLELLGPVKFPMRLKSTGWSPPTPAGGLEAGIVHGGYRTDDHLSHAGGPVKGAILLVHSNIRST